MVSLLTNKLTATAAIPELVLVLEDFLMTLTPAETLLKIDYVQLTGTRELRPWDTI